MAFASDVPPSYVEFVSEMLAQTPLEVVADFYPAFDELDEYQALPGLSRLPVVVVGGEDDLFTPVAHTDRITELLPDAVSLRLKNCGHLGMIEHADRSTRCWRTCWTGSAPPAEGPGQQRDRNGRRGGQHEGGHRRQPGEQHGNAEAEDREPGQPAQDALEQDDRRGRSLLGEDERADHADRDRERGQDAGPARDRAPPAAPVTARTSAAVATARAGRSHHGQCSTAGPRSGDAAAEQGRDALHRSDRQHQADRRGQAYAEQRQVHGEHRQPS